jgi:glyoxylase-like metal-dependent hydrolase (beta-lactamase superfamily II)
MAEAIPYGGAAVRIGDLTVLPAFDGYSREEPTHFYAVHPDAPPQRGDDPSDWAPYRSFLDRDGLMEHGLGGFVVTDGDRTVMVDAGVGPQQVGPYGPYNRVISGGELPGRLQQLGIDPAVVTDVILTHLHPDHFGWVAVDRGSLFPNAVFRCHLLDWEHFVAQPETLSPFYTGLRDLEPRFQTFDHDGPLLPGIDIQHAPGHTPGSSILVLSSGTARGLLLGDVVHCPVELVDEEWASLGDVDPALARRIKVALARELEGTDIPVVGAHFPGMRFGRLLQGEATRRWEV